MIPARALCLAGSRPWQSPVRGFVFERREEPDNLPKLQTLEKGPHPAGMRFYPVEGATHFSTLHPMTRLIARKIVADHVAFTPEEIARAVQPK